MELAKDSAEEKIPTGFFKEKILKNTSLAYGILFGVVAEGYLIGVGGRSNEGVILYFLRQIFS